MKILSHFLAVCLVASQSLSAQEPTEAKPADAPAGQSLELIPSQPVPLTPSTAPEPLPLIPDSPEPAKKRDGRALDQQKKKSSTEAAADEIAQRVRFRQMKTRAQNDPAVQAAWERSEAAPTDFEKREALTTYYKLLFGRITKLDASLKGRVALAQQRALRRLEQRRVDATEPVDADERAERLRE